MQKRICSNCFTRWYSSDSRGIWECEICGGVIPVPSDEIKLGKTILSNNKGEAMNIKLLKLRITKKRLKAELKECKRVIFLKDNINLSLAARKDVCSNLIRQLEDTVENQKNEANHLEKENRVWQNKYNIQLQEDSGLEKKLLSYRRKFDVVEGELIEAKELTRKYEENVDRLSYKVSELTKENEYLKDKGIANKVKNIFKRR